MSDKIQSGLSALGIFFIIDTTGILAAVRAYFGVV